VRPEIKRRGYLHPIWKFVKRDNKSLAPESEFSVNQIIHTKDQLIILLLELLKQIAQIEMVLGKYSFPCFFNINLMHEIDEVID
jgi:hypothetical protein